MVFDTHITYVPAYIHLISVGLTQACPNNLLNHVDVTRDYMRKKSLQYPHSQAPPIFSLLASGEKLGRTWERGYNYSP